MTIRHQVCMRFHPGTTAEQVAALADGLRELPALIPEIVAYRAAPDAGFAPTSWDFGVSADFASAEDFLTYRDHPEHQDRIARLITPIAADRVSVQLEI